MTVLREGAVSGALNVFFIYKFLRILTQPFNETDAFKLGIIDENGKILKKHRKLKTQEEKDSYTLMHRLVWKLKRLMEKIPFGKSRLASYAAALWLIKESHKFNGTEEELQETFLSFLETDWENEARIIKEVYEADMDKKTFGNLREGHKKGHVSDKVAALRNLPPHLAKFFDKKGNLKKDAADRVRKDRKQRGVKITDRTPDWMFGEGLNLKPSLANIDKIQRGIEKELKKKVIDKEHVYNLMHVKDKMMMQLYKREEAPPGWEGTIKAMKKKKNIDNPWALAWHMHNKGMKPHIPEELGGIMEEILDEKRKSLKNTKDVGMECQECGKKFRAKLSTLEYGKTKCPKCKSTDLDFQFGEDVEVDEKLVYKFKVKPRKVKKMKDLRLYAKTPSKKKSSSSTPHVPAFGISRKGGFGAGKGYGAAKRAPIMMGEDELNEKDVAVPASVDNLKQIVKDKQNAVFMFKDGKARVDLFSASALMGVYNALKPATRKKFETMIKTKGGFMKSVEFAFKMAKEEVDPHAKVMAKRGDSPEKIKDMHPEITDDELEKLFKEEFNVTTVTTFKSFLSEGRPSLDPDYVPATTQTDKMRAKLLSTQKKLYSSKDIESMARKYKQKLVGDPVGGKSWGGDWEIVLRNGVSLSYEYGPNSTYIKGWKFDRKAIKNYINKYANEHETPRDYAPMGGKVLVGGLEAAFEVISEHCGHCEMGIDEEFWVVIDTAKKDEVMAVSSDEKGARDSVKFSTTSKRDYHYGKDPKTLKVVKVKGKHSDKKAQRMIGEPLKEEAPANSVAGGNVNLDPFKKKRKNAKVETESFAGQKVFVVTPDVFYQSRLGKSRYLRYEKFVGNDKLGEAIRQYGRENPKAAIILKNSVNGAMLYLKYGKK